MSTNTLTMRAHWGAEAPEWVVRLAELCDRKSQAEAARVVGYSAGVISQVLNATYSGNLDRVQARVEGALMDASVACPVLGEVTRDQCLDHQRRPYSNTNPTRVRLYRACRAGCPNSQLGRRS